MKWRKLGQIFRPDERSLPNGCFAYAQSPQALVFSDFVRVYFSTRSEDQPGKFLSHVCYADFKKDFSDLIRTAKHTVIPLGELGCFDEHGIFPFSPFRHGQEIWAYTTGWNRKISVSADGAIGLAKSDSRGESFAKLGHGPVMAAALHEPFLVGDGFVRHLHGSFHMWYIYGLRWISSQDDHEPERVYKIAHAVSDDGVAWTRDSRQIVPDKIDAYECQALPCVLQHNARYHLFFCYRAAFGFRERSDRAYRIGYAHSTDLANWDRDDELLGIDVSPNGWDSEMMCYPHVFRCDDKVYMLYNGNQFGRHGFGLAILEEEKPGPKTNAP